MDEVLRNIFYTITYIHLCMRSGWRDKMRTNMTPLPFQMCCELTIVISSLFFLLFLCYIISCQPEFDYRFGFCGRWRSRKTSTIATVVSDYCGTFVNHFWTPFRRSCSLPINTVENANTLKIRWPFVFQVSDLYLLISSHHFKILNLSKFFNHRSVDWMFTRCVQQASMNFGDQIRAKDKGWLYSVLCRMVYSYL